MRRIILSGTPITKVTFFCGLFYWYLEEFLENLPRFDKNVGNILERPQAARRAKRMDALSNPLRDAISQYQ